MEDRLIPTFCLLVLDIVWIKFYMGGRYAKMIPTIQGSPMVTSILSAGLAYLALVVGLWVFVIPLAKREGYTWCACLKYGGLFGLVVYSVYDFTCGAVFSGWDMTLALQDILWGGFLFTIACYSANWTNHLGGPT